MTTTLSAPWPVVSPCVNVCRMDAASGLCEGCLRTLPEIAAWGQMDDAARLAVWAELPRRRAARAAARPPAGPGDDAPGAPAGAPR